MTEPKKPKLSIGMPIYNAEKFLRSRLDSLLSQTFTDFELIISDDASVDSTSEICREYISKDKRVQYIRQEKNIGGINNFHFVLHKAKGEYFFWAAQDDVILPGFIEKNLEVLKNEKIVCSASQVKYYGEKTKYIKNNEDSKIIKKIIKKFSPLKNISTKGSLNHKIRKYLKSRGHHHIFYGIFRTDQLKKIFVSEIRSGFDWATLLNALKFGDFYVIDQILMLRYDGGNSSKGFFNYKKYLDVGFFEALFHYIPFTQWCFRNLGTKICIRNLDLFLLINLEGIFYFGVDIIRIFMRKIR